MTVFDQPGEHRHTLRFLAQALRCLALAVILALALCQVASSPKLNLQKYFFLLMLLSKIGIKLNIIQPLNNANLQT